MARIIKPKYFNGYLKICIYVRTQLALRLGCRFATSYAFSSDINVDRSCSHSRKHINKREE